NFYLRPCYNLRTLENNVTEQSAFETWLQPLKLASFLKEHWTKIPYFSESNVSRLQFTENLLPSLDLSILLEHSREPIKVWYRDGEKPVYSFQLGRKEAFHAY